MLRADIDNGIYALYTNYFEDFCTNHVDIQHTPQDPAFIGPDVDSANIVKTFKKDVIAILSPPEFDGSDPDSDNEMLHTVGSLLILKKVGNKKTVDITAAKNFCQLIALDLVAKIFYDKQNTDNQLTAHFTKRDYTIDPGTAENLDAYFGVLITVKFKALVNLEYNPARFI
jgi:hypothetical protein